MTEVLKWFFLNGRHNYSVCNTISVAGNLMTTAIQVGRNKRFLLAICAVLGSCFFPQLICQDWNKNHRQGFLLEYSVSLILAPYLAQQHYKERAPQQYARDEEVELIVCICLAVSPLDSLYVFASRAACVTSSSMGSLPSTWSAPVHWRVSIVIWHILSYKARFIPCRKHGRGHSAGANLQQLVSWIGGDAELLGGACREIVPLGHERLCL